MITEEEITQAAYKASNLAFKNSDNSAYFDQRAFVKYFTIGAKWGLEQLEEKWISVKEKDRLPEEGEYYLVAVKNKNKENGIPLFDVGYFEEGEFHKSNTWEDVTEWIPLPEYPKD